MLLRKVNGYSIMSSNEKVSNSLGEGKEAVGTTLLSENKYSTNDVDIGIE